VALASRRLREESTKRSEISDPASADFSGRQPFRLQQMKALALGQAERVADLLRTPNQLQWRVSG